MSQIIAALKKKYPEFRTRKMTLEGFHNICSRENINTWNENIPWDGWYFRFRGEDFIIIKRGLSPTYHTFVFFHRLAHHFLHPGDTHYYKGSPGYHSKIESQAYNIALCAIYPAGHKVPRISKIRNIQDQLNLRLIYQENREVAVVINKY